MKQLDNRFVNTELSDDTTPQLGGDLDTNAQAINESYATVASHATTSAIWAAAGNVINFTGTETITDFPAADRAGSTRTLICAGATVFTHAGNITVQGGVTYTASAGDEVVEVIAISTTTFYVKPPTKFNGVAIDMADSVLTRPKFIDVSETVNALGDLGGGTDDIDLTTGNVVTATVSTSEETFTFSNPPASGSNGSFTLFLTNGGSQTINYPGGVDWVDATAPELTASGLDVLVFTTNDAGTTWLGFVAGLDVS